MTNSMAEVFISLILRFLDEPAAGKRDLKTYAKSKDPDQTVHPRSLVRIFAVRPHNMGTLLKI